MAFKDLGDWADLIGLRLPIGGRVYTLPPISAELGPRVQALIDFGIDIAIGNEGDLDEAGEVLGDVAERDLYKEVLGPVYEVMQADGVPWAALKHAAMTSIIDSTRDREEAELYWERLGKPEPVETPVKQPRDRARKATASKTTKASTAGTTSPRSPARKAQPGRRSSSSGT